MTRRIVGASLILAAMFLLPSMDAFAQAKKKKDGPKKSDVPVDSAKLSGEFVGLLKTVPGTERLFTVETENKTLVPTGKGGKTSTNANANRLLSIQNQMAQAQARMASARTPQQRLQAAQRLQQLQLQQQQLVLQIQQKAVTGGGKNGSAPPGFKWDTKKQTIEFQASDRVKVRSMMLPEQFDEKGNLKSYTDKEKAELKGKDKSLPGYESSLEKLEVGQKVRVKLSPAPRKPTTKDKDKDKDEEVKDADKKMQVTLIVILEESAGGAPAKKGKGKKAK